MKMASDYFKSQILLKISAFSIFFALMLPLSANAQGMAAPVEVDEAKTQLISETVAVFGELVSTRSGPIHVSISAPVQSIHVNVGDRLEEGALIATLDPTALQLQKATVEARIEMSTWATSRRKTELELAQQQEDRFRQLRHSAATTEAQHEDSLLRLKIAEQALGESRAAAQQIQRELDISAHNLSLTEITAPYSGFVVDRNIEIGQYVRVGERVVTLIGDHNLEVEAYIPYRYIEALSVGDTINAEFDNGTTFDIHLRAFIPEEHVSTRTRAVRFEFEQDRIEEQLAVNQNVIIHIPISNKEEVVTVHKDAVVTLPNGHVVYVVLDGVVNSKPIQIGRATGNRYEVVDGLRNGEIVVTRGNERLKPGQAVDIVN